MTIQDALFEGALTVPAGARADALSIVRHYQGATASLTADGVTFQARAAGLNDALMSVLTALARLGAHGAVHEIDGDVSFVLALGEARKMERQKVYTDAASTAEATQAVLRAVREGKYSEVPDALRALGRLSASRAEATLDTIESVALHSGNSALLKHLATVTLSDVRPTAGN